MYTEIMKKKTWIIIAVVIIIAIVLTATTVGAVLGIKPKTTKAVINGPGFPKDYPVENYGTFENRYYYAAVLPNTQNIVVLEVKFEVGTTDKVEQSISRVLVDGAKRSRTTDAELEQIYQDATVSTAKYYGDNYVLSKIENTI